MEYSLCGRKQYEVRYHGDVLKQDNPDILVVIYPRCCKKTYDEQFLDHVIRQYFAPGFKMKYATADTKIWVEVTAVSAMIVAASLSTWSKH